MHAIIRRATLGAAAIVLTTTLAGCGSSDSSSAADPAGDPTSSSSSTSGPTLDVTVKGDTVTPNGDRIDVKIGETVTINVTSDRAGELHVHSTPEQELEYDEGSTTLHVTIDKPGIIDVEDHIADVVVAQLQVS